eukprot:scaffold47_cov112-Isochrysis_galbana.AAC.1
MNDDAASFAQSHAWPSSRPYAPARQWQESRTISGWAARRGATPFGSDARAALHAPAPTQEPASTPRNPRPIGHRRPVLSLRGARAD